MPFMVTEVSANLVGMRCNEGKASLNIIKPTPTIGVNWKAKGSRKYRESFLHETSEKQGTTLRFGLEGRQKLMSRSDSFNKRTIVTCT